MNCFAVSPNMMVQLQKVLPIFVAMLMRGGFTSVDYSGTEFLVTFVKNLYRTGSLQILISAETDANVTVNNNMDGSSDSYFVSAGTSHQVQVADNDYRYSTDQIVESKTLYIQASSPVNVFTLNYYTISSDGYHVIPIKALSTEYIVVSYPTSREVWIAAAAVEDSTTVRFQLKLSDSGSCGNDKLTDGAELSFDLNRFHVVGTYCKADVTGTIIMSNKPITVVVGHTCTSVPEDKTGCDKLEEMIPSTANYGYSFVLFDLAERGSGSFYRVVARNDSTNISTSDGKTYSVGRGDFVEIDTHLTGQLCLTSDRPVLVVLIAKGKDASGTAEIGDPFMTVVPSTGQFLFQAFVSYLFNVEISMKFYVAVLVHRDDINNLSGEVRNAFVNISFCNYGVATLEQTSATLTLNNDSTVPVGVIAYSFGENDAVAFGFHLGMALVNKEEESTSVSTIYNVPNSLLLESTSSWYSSATSSVDSGETQNDSTLPISSSEMSATDITSTSVTEFSDLATQPETSSSEDIETSSSNYVSADIIVQTTVLDTTPYSTTAVTYSEDVPTSDNYISASSLLDVESTSVNALKTFSEETTVQGNSIDISESLSSSFDVINTTPTAKDSQSPIMSPLSTSVPTSSANQLIPVSSSITSTDSQASVFSVCKCSCRQSATEQPDSVSQLVDEIKRNLTVDTTVLGKTIRKFISVKDDRPSAQAVGATGIIFIFIAAGLIVLPDIMTSFRHMKRAFNGDFSLTNHDDDYRD